MKHIYRYTILILLVTTSFGALGQNKTSYFVKNSTLRHNLNASFAPDQGYIGIPVLSNINVGVLSNMGASNFLFPLQNGKVALFLHKDVPADAFLNSFSSSPYLNASMDMDILNAGWFSWKDSFWSVSLGVKTDINSSIPTSMFEFMKKGMQNDPQHYTISNLSFGEDIYTQLSLGYSQGLDKYLKGLRLGGKIKMLFGLSSMNASINQFDINMGSDAWRVSSNASGSVLGGGIKIEKDPNGVITNIAFDASTLSIGGVGMAVDFGIEYRLSQGTPLDGLTFSLSVADLGFISYFKNQSKDLIAQGNASFSGFKDMNVENFDFQQEIDKVKEQLLSMASFKEQISEKGKTKMVSAKVYAGIEYQFLNDKMGVGLLYSGRFGQYRYDNELTLSYNYAPVRWFDVALSYSFLNSRQSIGWLLTFVPKKGLNIFFGSDYTCLNYTPQGIPVKNAYLDFNIGISVPLGGINRRY